ncbi:hypothetical protein [Tindallia californiensis]|uniref:Uncharacterized protein n=1 Tax=Tindallia californiensis TaxID=159292 RepID=A0A1H3IIB5_9FIRM|nr:hypothetical protein [Tindallia californiensis]SDY27506.1 hypothetical protein SAMN05192546_101170 [Tindallia californiensis]
MERRNRERIKEKIHEISCKITEDEAEKLLDLFDEEAKKVAKGSIYSLEIQYMLDEWMEEEFPDQKNDGDRTIH